jgi:uncharacterized protein involved in response to NO
MRIERDPFRLFFPFGAILAIVGVFPWALQLFGSPSYPVEFHRAIMMNGFMLSFVCGFLMTAIPRFTSADFAKLYEILWIAGAILAGAICEIVGLQAWHHLFSTLALVGLIVFAFQRFRKRKSNPPFTFIFVGVGLALWTLSNFLIFWSMEFVGLRPASLSIWGEVFSHGALMSIVLGVGGRLIPGVLGWQEIVTTQREKYERTDAFSAVVPPSIWIMVGLFLSSYFFADLFDRWICLALRAFVIWFFAFRYWRIHRPPKEKSFFTWSVWVSGWCFAVGAALNVVWPNSYVHSLHTILVGGFSLLTVLIATRVTLAHGCEGRGPEKTSKMIPIFTALIILAMLTRVTAILWPRIYLDHLSYASLTWIMGFMLWGFFAVPRMLRSK